MKRYLTRLVAWTLTVLMLTVMLSSVALAEGNTQKITMLFSAGGSGKAIAAAAERFTAETGIKTDVLLFSLNEVYGHQRSLGAAAQGLPGAPDHGAGHAGRLCARYAGHLRGG